MATNAPKPTGKLIEFIALTGMLLPWRQEQPVYLKLGGSDYYYLPVFGEEWLLRETMEKARTSFEKIKQINSSPEFLTSFPVHIQKQVRIAVNLRFTPEGKTRWIEVAWPQTN